MTSEGSATSDTPMEEQEIQNSSPRRVTKHADQFESFLSERDYMGAVTLLKMDDNDDVLANHTRERSKSLWLGYCYYHLRDYNEAAKIYHELIDSEKEGVACNRSVHTYLACCYYMLGQKDEALKELDRSDESPLRAHLLQWISFSEQSQDTEDDETWYRHQETLDISRSLVDLDDEGQEELLLAAMKYSAGDYRGAIQIYRALLDENKSYEAINVYLACCYHKLHNYTASQANLEIYMKDKSNSFLCENLKACNLYYEYDFDRRWANEVTEKCKQVLSPCLEYANDLLSHNMVVFSDGDKANEKLPRLFSIVPESKYNYLLYSLQRGEADVTALKDFKPKTPTEVMLQALIINDISNSEESLSKNKLRASVVFERAAKLTKDPILREQAFASASFLQKEFETAVEHLSTIESFQDGNDCFYLNYGQAQAAIGNYDAAIKAFQSVKSGFQNQTVYIFWLARCYIRSGRSYTALELRHTGDLPTPLYLQLLLFIANDCYKIGEYMGAAQAFGLLHGLSYNKKVCDGLFGACAGAFQMITKKQLKVSKLVDIKGLLALSADANQAKEMLTMINRWERKQDIGQNVEDNPVNI